MPEAGGPPCGACGAPLRQGARFCGRCGASQPGKPVPAPEAKLPEGGGGLLAALGGYFAVLTPLLVILAMGDVAIETLRIADYIIVGVGVLGIAVYHRANLRLLGLPRLDARGVPPLLLGLGVIAAVLVLLQLTMPFMFMDETEPYRLAGKSLTYLLIDFAVLPAIGEELVFRGVVLSGLLGVFQARTAALVSAMLFATIHLSPLSFVHLSILGYILARVRLGTGSLWPCMLIHGGYNAVICLLAW